MYAVDEMDDLRTFLRSITDHLHDPVTRSASHWMDVVHAAAFHEIPKVSRVSLMVADFVVKDHAPRTN